MSRQGRYGAKDGTSARDDRVDRLKMQIKCNVASVSDMPVLSLRALAYAPADARVG